MAVSISDIAGLKDRKVYETSNEKIVLAKDYEKIIHSPLYTILGFLNGYMYSSTGNYLSKSTTDGEVIADVKVELEHATFSQGSTFFYAWAGNTVYKITQNLDIEWSKEFENNIQSAVMDVKGAVYIVLESGRDIRKYSTDGSEIAYIDGSDDPSKDVKLFNLFVSKGAGWLYVIGTEYWDYDNKASSFIDKYNARTWERVERIEISSGTYVSEDDLQYHYDNFFVVGDYIYIYAMQYISKINIKAVEYWRYMAGYNSATGTHDTIGHIEFSDNPKNEYLYFVENLESSNGHAFGKFTLRGNLMWKITLTDSMEDIDFKMCIYENKMYITDRALVKTKKGYILSLNDEQVLFKTRDGHLVEIVDVNEDELFSPDNYYGMYLLADQIKEGIPKIVYHPLRHDDGDMINEDGDVLLLPEENFNYTDPENYDYKYLLCSNYSVDANDFSIIFAKNYRPVITKLKNVIKTKQPYLPDRIHEFILSMPGNRIDTMQDYDLIRRRFMYSYDRYLLADRNMFNTDIITKDLGLTIITKAKGYHIVMKRRNIYTYLLSRYDDINLLEAWLIENGVTMTSLPGHIQDLIHHTFDAIQDIQMAGTPVQYDIQPYKEHEYMFDGTEFYNNTWGTQIFSCTNLPYDKRRCVKEAYIDSLANMVANQEIRPFMIFLNGRAIPWSDITIVRDWSYSYLLINNTDPYETDISCVVFPCDIRYGEDNDCLPEDVCDTYFYFDNEGKLTSDRSKVAIRMEIIDKNIVGGTFDYSKGYIEVENNYMQRASERNIFVFEDNLLFPDSRYYIQDHSKDIFTYLRDTDNAVFKTFYWIKANDYYGIMYKIPNGDYTKTERIKQAKNNTDSVTDDFAAPFNYHMWRNKTWEQNVAQAVAYIMQYDMSLLVQYYKEQSHIQSYTFDGEYLINRVPKDGGWLIMPRSRRNSYDDYIMVFRNHHLYEYYKEIQYDTHNFKIPIFNHVGRDDVIEIVHFKEVDNRYYHLTVSSDKQSDYLPEGLRYDNFLLFGNSPSGKQFYDRFSVERGVQYDVEFAYKNNFDKTTGKYINTDIKLEDEYYIDKPINIASKRQFRHMYYNIFYERDEVNLDPSFRFCHDKSKYMIFKNWDLLLQDDWDLIIPTNETPAMYITLKFDEKLQEGDEIEIFYLPMSYDEIYIGDEIDWDKYREVGDINIDMSSLGYQFDKDLFWLAYDGKKINYSIIENINNHRCRLTADPLVLDPELPTDTDGSWPPTTRDLSKNVYLYRFLQPDQLLSKLYSYSDNWSDATDSLSIKDYETLLTKHIKG